MCSQSRHPLLILTSLNVPHTRVFSSAAKTLSGGRVRSPRCFSLFRLNSCESNVPGFAPKARARTCPASRASRLPAHAGVSHLVRNSRERRFRVWAFSITFLDFARRASRTRVCSQYLIREAKNESNSIHLIDQSNESNDRAFDSHLLPGAFRGGENGGKRPIMTQDLIQFDSSQNFESNSIRLIDQSKIDNTNTHSHAGVLRPPRATSTRARDGGR